MTLKTQDDFERLLNRFYGFSDGVIRGIRLRYQDDGTRNGELEVACRDSEATENGGWVSVRLLIRNVQEFTVRERSDTTLQVLSEGLHIRVANDGVGIEFGGTLEFMELTSDLRKSDAFIVGEEIEIEVGPY